MAQSQLLITVGGDWLILTGSYGDVEMSTVWPGGSDELSWSYGDLPIWRYRGNEIVKVFYGPVCVWMGYLIEPDPSQDTLTAQGLWQLGYNFAALDGTGAATNNFDTAIDRAIPLGLPWTRPTSINAGAATAVDLSQGPVTIGALLDAKIASSNAVSRWGVDTSGAVFTALDPTTPSYHTLPLREGLGYALDDYASTLTGRYLDSSTSTFKTVTVANTNAAQDHGYKEQIVDLVTGRAAMTAAQATILLTNLLTYTKAIPQWTASLEFSYGELLSRGGVPVALETVAAGTMLRVHGGFELAQRVNGAMYVDIVIGRTDLTDGTLTITPMALAPRSLTDVLTSLGS